MEDWGRDRDWNHDVLMRIVALLFSLAHLADLASDHPARRRRQALGFLVFGEAEARAFAIEMVSGAPIEVDEPGFCDDAAGLAARLRVLGFMVWFLAAQARRSARPGAGPRTLRREQVGRSMPAGLSAVRKRRSVPPATDSS